MSVTGLKAGASRAVLSREEPVPWLTVTSLPPPLYLPSLLCQTSLCLPLVRIYAVAFRVHADNPGWSPHVKILNHICKEPFWPCEAKGHVRWRLQVPGIRMRGIFSGGMFQHSTAPKPYTQQQRKSNTAHRLSFLRGQFSQSLEQADGVGSRRFIQYFFQPHLIFQLLPLDWLSRYPQGWPFL